MKKNLMKRTLAGTLAVMTVAGTVPADLYMNDLFGTAVINASADEQGDDITSEKTVNFSEIKKYTFLEAGTTIMFDKPAEFEFSNGEMIAENFEVGDTYVIPVRSYVAYYYNNASRKYIALFADAGDFVYDSETESFKCNNTDKPYSGSVFEYTAEEDCAFCVMNYEKREFSYYHLIVDGKGFCTVYDEGRGYLNLKKGQKITAVYCKCSVDPNGSEPAEIKITDIFEPALVEAVPHTCDEDGTVEHYVDEDGVKYVLERGMYFSQTDEELADPAAHTYGEPVWKWDGTDKATATFECEHGDSQDIVEAVITAETNGGMTVYTATVEFGEKTYTDTKTVYNVVKPEYIAGDGCVKLTWDAVEGAEKYAVCGYVSGKWQLIDEGYTTSYILNGLKSGNEYKVAVIAKINGKWVRDFSEAITVSPKAKVGLPELTVTAQNNRLVLDWTAVEGAEKYGVAVYISGKWKVQAYTDADVTTFTSPKLSAGTYKMVVCAKVNGKWNTKNINSGAVECTIE